ncbi:hypothetical protein D5041_04210 [Verminephrobacter aporrectodeae subsp. tuberculatae]|nr:hypothetical protein [Verminephrobacter aporrectodeae subsp. tuberculatae]MCW5288294.1 hypothetical protein [Verminephrobacter aporrectodeae subsp. tuberculatae]
MVRYCLFGSLSIGERHGAHDQWHIVNSAITISAEKHVILRALYVVAGFDVHMLVTGNEMEFFVVGT